jgi:hypothetical protein
MLCNDHEFGILTGFRFLTFKTSLQIQNAEKIDSVGREKRVIFLLISQFSNSSITNYMFTSNMVLRYIFNNLTNHECYYNIHMNGQYSTNFD